MAYNFNNYGLPFLPGCSFRDPAKSAFHRTQTLGYRNGFSLAHRVGIYPDEEFQLTHQDITDLTYGPSEPKLDDDFLPAHVVFDKKVLRYYGYFVEDMLNSPGPQYRVRPVIIYYYLVDDSMSIFEPRVHNSGTMQGPRVKRQRFPKKEHGEYYQFNDLNLRMDLDVYGVTYRITHCDAFTREFMDSEGIVVNDPEPIPLDPFCKRWDIPQPSQSAPAKVDKLYQFLNLDGQVLRFFALFDDADEIRYVKIYYYLADDTVEIRHSHEPNNGQDPFPVLLHRSKLPKPCQKENFPSCVMEVSEEEVEYCCPKDFQLGQMIQILGRNFLLYESDGFTKDYYKKVYPEMEVKPIKMTKASHILEQRKEIPPYNGFGTLEDSLQNCLYLIPKPPKINLLKRLEKQQEVLRYSARLESQHPEDEIRRFILSYYLTDDMISIFEKPSGVGFLGGMFLQRTRVPKPGSTVDDPVYYSPADFAIGATVEVFSHCFVLTDADLYVLNYLETIEDQIPPHTMDSLRQKLSVWLENQQPVDRTSLEEPSQ